MTYITAYMRGIRQAQQWNLRAVRALRPEGAFGRVIQQMTVDLHRYAVVITHKDTGALANSHRMEINELFGRIYIDPASRNPKSSARPVEYGPAEESRGGEHAFYQRTVDERVGVTITRIGVIVSSIL